MAEKKRSFYIRVLAIIALILAGVILLVTFSDSRLIPNWDTLFSSFKEEEPAPEEDFVRFIDVGQGDSILISSNGYNCLVDFGNQSDYGSGLLTKLRSYGVEELDCVILSHYDTDHVGGAAKIVNAFEVHYAVLPELYDRSETVFDDFQYALESNKTEVTTSKAGTVINIGEFEITVLAYNKNAQDDNDQSVIIMAETAGKKFLFTGDAGASVEADLLSEGINVDCDVYKAAHHGSRNSNSEAFIAAASPEYAVYSVGASNQYGHPHEEVTEILEAAGARIYRTDKSGDITFYVESGSIRVETEY